MLRATIFLTLTMFLAAVRADAPDAEDLDRPAAPRPNVLLVLCDDLGYGDLACYGHSRIQTPNIDRFAAEGLRLTDCYAAAANCSPARAGLMTGRTPTRVGVFNWIPFYSPMHLRRSEITIATLLRNAGYQTCHVGKWHLNGHFNLPSQPQPWDHGFSYWFSTQNNALPNHRNPNNFVRNGRPVGPLEGYSAAIVADEAIGWLRNHRHDERPFFLFVCFHEPHEPIASAKRYTDLYPSDDPSLSAHHGNVSQMDDAFGRLLGTLEELTLRDDTLVVLTSDNGPAITAMHPHGSAGPLRAKKGYLYEGGIRVPGIIQWPGVVEPGTVSHQPVSGVDLLPTLCELAGIHPPSDRAVDGISLVPLLHGKNIQRTKPLYWHFLRASDEKKVAMRDGQWKLVARLTTPSLSPSGNLEAVEMQDLKNAQLVGFELFDLPQDIAEQNDVKQDHPEVLERLRRQMILMHDEVRREAPTWPEWEFARYESERIQWPDYWLERRRLREIQPDATR